MLHAASLFLLIAAAVGLCALLLQLIAVRVHLRKARLTPTSLRPISILKPLCGVDDDLEKNLECFATLDYPAYEVLLGVRDTLDPAFAVARRAVARWPKRMRLVLQRGEPGFNPKVNQLVTLEKAARAELLVISDSNTRVSKDYLREIAACFEDPEVGCVTHPIVGEGEERLGSLLDNLHLASAIGPGMIAAKVVAGKDLVVGKSMALRRADVAAMGGFLAMKDFLAEDYVIGQRVSALLGKKVAVARGLVINVSQRKSPRDFLKRYVRWSIIHHASLELGTYFAHALMNPLPLALLAAALYPSGSTLLAVLAVGVLKALIDVAAARSLRPSAFGLVAMAAVPLKDVLLFAAWVNALFQSTVNWRGNLLRVGPGSRLYPVEADEATESDESLAA
ncbi:MAG: glycosyltransferase [Myxococcaceae bacterium]